jgi:SAM-dependent methyltransferase
MVCRGIDEPDLLLGNWPLPGFPAVEIQESTTGQSGAATLCEANIFYEDCIHIFDQITQKTLKDKVLLDFGTGWGRILRFFMEKFSPENLIGVDIRDDLLDICKSTFKWGNFIKSEAFPPLEIKDQSVDFIVGYSVFSHLSEDACASWLNEFNRILRPGGIIAVTTRGRWFFDYCEQLKDKNTDYYSNALANLFSSFDETRKAYDNGEFIHASIGGGGILEPSFYGETWIPENYAKREYSHLFNVHPFYSDPARSEHPIMILQKK